MDTAIFKKIILSVVFSIMLSFVMTDYALAHKVTLFAWVEGEMVYTESKFSGGKKAQNAPIEVFDAHGKKIFEGKTDKNGKFSFKAPRKTEMKIVLLAGMGHRAEWTIPLEEFVENTAENAEKPAVYKMTAPEADKINKSELPSKEDNGKSPCLTPEDVQILVEKTLDKKLKPVITRLNKAIDPDRGPSISDILGGIGYILGLMGIGVYFNYRNKKRNDSKP